MKCNFTFGNFSWVMWIVKAESAKNTNWPWLSLAINRWFLILQILWFIRFFVGFYPHVRWVTGRRALSARADRRAAQFAREQGQRVRQRERFEIGVNRLGEKSESSSDALPEFRDRRRRSPFGLGALVAGAEQGAGDAEALAWETAPALDQQAASRLCRERPGPRRRRGRRRRGRPRVPAGRRAWPWTVLRLPLQRWTPGRAGLPAVPHWPCARFGRRRKHVWRGGRFPRLRHSSFPAALHSARSSEFRTSSRPGGIPVLRLSAAARCDPDGPWRRSVRSRADRRGWNQGSADCAGWPFSRGAH